MMTSALLQHGIDHLASVLARLVHWMEEHEYESIRQMRGSMPALRIRSGGFRARKLYACPQLLQGTKGALRDHNRG